MAIPTIVSAHRSRGRTSNACQEHDADGHRDDGYEVVTTDARTELGDQPVR
jgi:hypothetical protein